MKNINQVRQEAISVFDGLKTGTIEFGIAKEMTNAIGKVINTLKVELEYAALRKETPNIPFMAYDSEADEKEAAKVAKDAADAKTKNRGKIKAVSSK